MVRAGELGAGGLEAATGNRDGVRGGAESCTGHHLVMSVKKAIGGLWGRTVAAVESGGVGGGLEDVCSWMDRTT